MTEHAEHAPGAPAEPGRAVVTRWWWVRHAPVRVDGGRIYGARDLDCDCSDEAGFAALAGALPRGAVWLASHLRRTHQTAAALLRADPALAADRLRALPDLAEQDLGAWQGLDRAAFLAGRRLAPGSGWFAPADERAPGGESFADLCARVAGAVARETRAHPGRDIVAVAHGGTIRAALALALDLPPQGGLAFSVDNTALTRLDHVARDGAAGWRVAFVNARVPGDPGRGEPASPHGAAASAANTPRRAARSTLPPALRGSISARTTTRTGTL